LDYTEPHALLAYKGSDQ